MLDPLTSTAFAVHNGKGIYALLLGSGISRAANIPTGWEVTLDLIRRIATMRNASEACNVDPEAWYKACFKSDPSYSGLLEQLAISQAERTTALARYFDIEGDEESTSGRLTATHIAIAKMVKRGYFRVILTTNFDRLLERALEAEGVSPAVLSTPDAIQGAIPLAHSACTVVKLHGDYRDARLRNTDVELGAYDETTQRLLDRVLDDYGLIISGWSASWDVALRDSILRAPNRRFTTVWSYVSQLSPEAESLIVARQAQKVQVQSADAFFVELNEKLESLESFDAPHPLSIELAVRAAKRYVAEDRYRIQLHDLVMGEVSQVVASAKQLSMQSEITEDLYIKRIALYETVVQRLLPVLVNVAYWGEQSLPIITGAVERLMFAASEFGGNTGWLNLQLYPAALCFYAAGLGLLATENYVGFRVLARDFRTTAAELNRRSGLATERLALQGILDKDWLNRATGKREYVPYSERAHEMLSSVFAKQLPGVVGFDDIFDRFEFLCALLVADNRMQLGKDWICGWFGRWVYRHRDDGENVRSILKAERDHLGADWGLVKAGVFPSPDRFDEVCSKHNTDCASRTHYL
jgi:hypothetical protein